MSDTQAVPPKASEPRWHEKWRLGIRTAETAIVIGFWVSGVADLDHPAVATLIFAGGAVIGSISVFAEPTRPLARKFLWALILDFCFLSSAGFAFYHRVEGVADGATKQLFQVEQAGGSRLEFTEVEPFYPPNANPTDPFFFKFSFKNSGAIAAEYPNIRTAILLPATWKQLSSANDYASNEDKMMASIITEAKKDPFSDSGNQIQPGDTDFFELGAKFSKADYQKLQLGQYQIGFGFVLKYTDAATPPGYANYSYFCAYLITNGTGGWQDCHSYNKVFVAKN